MNDMSDDHAHAAQDDGILSRRGRIAYGAEKIQWSSEMISMKCDWTEDDFARLSKPFWDSKPKEMIQRENGGDSGQDTSTSDAALLSHQAAQFETKSLSRKYTPSMMEPYSEYFEVRIMSL